MEVAVVDAAEVEQAADKLVDQMPVDVDVAAHGAGDDGRFADVAGVEAAGCKRGCGVDISHPYVEAPQGFRLPAGVACAGHIVVEQLGGSVQVGEHINHAIFQFGRCHVVIVLW